MKSVKSVAPSASAPGPWWLLWVALPACGTGLLLALTNQISQDVTPVPLLWVVPLALYLLSFILCFEGPRSYKRGFFIPASFASFLLLAWLLDQGYLHGFWLQVSGYLSVLFLGCMVCHGELYRLRPPAERLTAYYLAVSLGGALGGVFVGLVAPAVFRTVLETPILAVTVPALASFILWRERTRWSYRLASPAAAAALGTGLIVLGLGLALADLRKQSVYVTRNFYGAYRVKEGPTLLLQGMDFPLTHGNARVLLSGQIYHGLQFTDPGAARIPTSYFCEEEGLGVTFRALPATTNRNIGIIGMGAGTIAAYGRPGDRVCFYEINPDVLRIARTWFTFLTNSPAEVSVVMGDGRLSLEGEPDRNLDLFVLDAFSGDSIPMHLLTDEAMQTYRRHLKPDGVMAFHISNSHLDLEPVVRALAEKYGMTSVKVPYRLVDPREGKLAAEWILVSANPDFFKQPEVAAYRRLPPSPRQALLWTDDHSSILPILR